MSAILLTKLTVFDGTGAAPFPGEVLIEGNRIAAVARGAGQIDRSRAAEIIDAANATLMPGLVEPHAHLTFTSAVDRIVPTFMPPVEDHVFYVAHNAKTLLDYGFTSAFSGGATRPAIEVKLRDEIAKGFLPGPRIKAASFERSVDGNRRGYGQGVDEMKKFCREMIELGVDSMKFILSGAGSVIPKNFDQLAYAEPELEAASEMARDSGIKLLGHAYNSESIRMAIRHGFHAIFHCNFADEATLDLMEANKDKFFVVPAVGIIVAGLTRRDQLLPGAIEQSEEALAGLQTIHDAQLRVLPAMRKRGIRVLPGGDYGFAHNPHGRNAWEFELFVTQFGFSPVEVLVGATRHGGEIMGMGDRLGLVKEDYLADLIAVDFDPLKNIALFQDRNRITMIMKDGKFHKRPRRGAGPIERAAAE
jgi:imidazolonepropionase-like amidohydrolase